MLQVKTVWTGVGGVPYYTNLNFDGANLQTSADEVADLVADAWNQLDAWINTALTWTVQPEVNSIDTATGDVEATWIVASQSGTGSDADHRLPRMAQGIVTWLTGDFIGGRQVKGRTFVPGPTETANDSAGLPSSAYRDQLAAWAATLMGGEQELAVWSRTHSSQHVVAAASVGLNWAYLSSRRD